MNGAQEYNPILNRVGLIKASQLSISFAIKIPCPQMAKDREKYWLLSPLEILDNSPC